ncbi:MAG: ATP-binding protein [Sporichthyaceae bacterium]
MHGAQDPGTPTGLSYSPAGHDWLTTQLADAGDMGRLVLTHDWAASPLGPIERWSPGLRSAVAMCLASRHPMALWWGAELVVIYNDANLPLLGIKHPASLGRRGEEVWPEIWDEIGPMLRGVRQSGRGTWFSDQRLIIERHGFAEEAFFTYSNSPIFDPDGTVAGVMSASVETTVAMRAAQKLDLAQARARELTELDAAKTVFFSDISHELRTPLTLIAAPVADLLAERRGPINADQREFLQIVARNAGRLSELVRGMLDFARIEAGRLTPDVVAVDLPGVTSALAESFRPAIAAAGLSFNVVVNRLPRPVLLDPDMWDRIVLNLLSNALKYTLSGRITLSLGDVGDAVELTVSDSGIGIAPVDLPRLFERFYRARHSGGRSVEGSGIGLALVAELTRLHGGKVSVTSTPGRGSTFVVRVPYGRVAAARRTPHVADPARAAEPYLQEAAGWSTRQLETADPGRDDLPRLLVAEDGADMRGYLADVLREHFQVRFAVDGAQALELAREHPPEVLLADVMMPNMDGAALIAALKEDPLLRGVPVVMLSARAGDDASAAALRSGADDFVSKPFTASDLIARLSNALARSRARESELGWRPVVLDFLSDGVAVGDANGQVVEVNEAWARITGFGPEGVPYPPPYPWFPTEEQDPVGLALCEDAALRWLEREGTISDVPLRHRDGHRVWVRAIGAPSRSPVDGSTVLAAFIKLLPDPPD